MILVVCVGFVVCVLCCLVIVCYFGERCLLFGV